MQTIITDYAPRAADIRAIREQVFLIEQRVPAEEEFDDRDLRCEHVVVYDGDRPLGTARVDWEKDGKVGRVAVLKSQRRRGVGTVLMQAIEQQAMARGAGRLWCNAQVSAIAFYQSLGYSVCSGEFEEAHIPHVAMEKELE
ncbi:MAG: GNAT family N-acetyltransferase [Planctomycetales bacterium]|nr:GNAT family N-acetyltransferase [Planctomycetales bacterium]